jgi:hypothetical protein
MVLTYLVTVSYIRLTDEEARVKLSIIKSIIKKSGSFQEITLFQNSSKNLFNFANTPFKGFFLQIPTPLLWLRQR